MGRIHKKKGFDILIRAIKILNNKYSNSFLFIAGEDYGEKEKLLNLIKELNLKDYVFFIGHIGGNQKSEFLKNADVFALSSHDENFGLVYAEALASGVPIVASKNTPWKEVEEFNIGKWVENNEVSFANAIEEILKINYTDMQERCKSFINNNYSWSSIANKILDKFEEINSDRQKYMA